MSDLQLGGRGVSFSELLKALEAYSKRRGGSLRYYDFGGQDSVPAPKDEVSLEDLGRMTLLNPQLSGDDAAALLDKGATAPWHLVPSDALLEDCDYSVQGGLYDHALELHKHFADISGIKAAKVSKLLHLKRPNLFPILDAKVQRFYETAQATLLPAVQEVRPEHNSAYWAAIREDLIQSKGAFLELREQIPPGLASGRVQQLSTLRLIDIYVWHQDPDDEE